MIAARPQSEFQAPALLLQTSADYTGCSLHRNSFLWRRGAPHTPACKIPAPHNHPAAERLIVPSLCRDNKIPLIVFAINDPENIVRIVKGEDIGTKID